MASWSFTRASDVPPSDTFDSSHELRSSSALKPSGGSAGASSRSSSSVSSDSAFPRSSAAWTTPPTIPCASRNGTPWRTSRSATSVAAIDSSVAAAAIRSRSNSIPASISRATRRHSSSVSIASNSGSLSSWRSLL